MKYDADSFHVNRTQENTYSPIGESYEEDEGRKFVKYLPVYSDMYSLQVTTFPQSQGIVRTRLKVVILTPLTSFGHEEPTKIVGYNLWFSSDALMTVRLCEVLIHQSLDWL